MENQTIKEKLEQKGYTVSVFDTAAKAVEYLRETVEGQTIGFGGSVTLAQMDLKNVLAEKNTMLVSDKPAVGDSFRTTAIAAMTADLYFLSANAVSDEGEIVNVDGTCNRISGSLFGHKKVYYVISTDKIGGTLEQAIERARNYAAPRNAIRLGRETPCALAVKDRLEAAYRKQYGEDRSKWADFIGSLTEEELGTHCYDCQSPQRICSSVLVHLKRPNSCPAEVILIREPLGY